MVFDQTVMGKAEALSREVEEGEEELFFDSAEDLPISSNLSPKSASNNMDMYRNLDASYQVWLNGIGNVQIRRQKLFKSMGLELDLISPAVEPELHESNSLNDMVEESSDQDPYLERSITDGERTCSSSSLSSTPSSLSRLSSQSSGSNEKSCDVGYDLLIKNMDSGAVFVIDEVAQDGSLMRLHELGSNQTVRGGDFLSSFGSSQFVLNLMHKEHDSSKHVQRRERNNWLRRLGIKTYVNDTSVHSTESDSVKSNRVREETVYQLVKTSTRKKHWRELSEVYMCQDFKAHDGAILAMKFSHDGQFLATGGEDGILHVWCVMECESTTKDFDFHRDDSSNVYFRINENHQIISPIHNGDKKDRYMKWQGNSACVVIPERVFGIEEEPFQDLRGHVGDILDISWSTNKYLLSASTDKSVRLWDIGSGSCLQVFPHKNYVTCVQFNPANEDYFMTGSIDGIVRIWDITSSRVVTWIETKEILTALCFHPDGKKAVVGTMTGQCQLYDISGNELELRAEISLQGKRKSPHKRVTSLEFCPHDSTKLMVASADSIIRILKITGSEVILKYKGLRSHGNHVSASFAREGNHIISCNDNSIYLLNSASRVTSNTHSGKDVQSSEHFTSDHTSLAVPWNGAPLVNLQHLISALEDSHGNSAKATWPEEKIVHDAAGPLALSRSQFKFLKVACQSGTDTWGQVVVTAGWDGRIKSYQNFGLPVQA